MRDNTQPNRITEPQGVEQSRWSSILDGALREQAQAAIYEVAACWSAPLPALAREAAFDTGFRNASLAGGQAGMALLYAYLTQAGNGRGAGERAASLLEQAISTVARRRMDGSLYSGFTGVAWVTEHLQGVVLDADIAASHLHMHANRLLPSAQRAQELVIYEFLTRLYQAQLARHSLRAQAPRDVSRRLHRCA